MGMSYDPQRLEAVGLAALIPSAPPAPVDEIDVKGWFAYLAANQDMLLGGHDDVPEADLSDRHDGGAAKRGHSALGSPSPSTAALVRVKKTRKTNLEP